MPTTTGQRRTMRRREHEQGYASETYYAQPCDPVPNASVGAGKGKMKIVVRGDVPHTQFGLVNLI